MSPFEFCCLVSVNFVYDFFSSPLNGGRYCEGESRKFRTCNLEVLLTSNKFNVG